MTRVDTPRDGRAPAPHRRGRGSLRRALRRLARSRTARWLAITLYRGWIGLCARTTRWRHEGYDAVRARLEAGQPIVIVHWHDRIAMMPYAWDWSRHDLTAIASAHGDADFAVEKAAAHGMGALRLAPDQRIAALRRAVRLLRGGQSLLITPDGPRGPRHVAKPGAIEIAAMGRAPIVPMSYSTTRFLRIARSWDGFVLPLPFARGVFLWGEAIDLPARPTPQEVVAAQTRLAAALTALDARCDAECGQPPG